MSIASRILWRRRRALLIPSFHSTQSTTPGMPVQKHFVVLWLGFGVQITVSRMPDWLRRW